MKYLLCIVDLSGLRGQPDKLLWCVYRPVWWPEPSQPGVGQASLPPSKIAVSILNKRKANQD